MRQKRTTSSVRNARSLKKTEPSLETQQNHPTPPHVETPNPTQQSALAWRREQFDREMAAREQKLRIELLEKQLGTRSQQTVSDSAIPIESSSKRQLLERGKHCYTIREEIGRIRNLRGVRGLTIEEIQAKTPNFFVWDLVKQLPQEEQETFRQPSQWGPTAGYARRLLGHYYGKSPETVKGWIKAYRKTCKT